MLSAKDAFPDSSDLRNKEKTSERIKDALERVPARVSQECKDLLGCIFVINPRKRITIEGIKKNPWFLKKLPDELKQDGSNEGEVFESFQSEEEVKQIIEEAKSDLQMENDNDEDIADVVEYNTCR